VLKRARNITPSVFATILSIITKVQAISFLNIKHFLGNNENNVFFILKIANILICHYGQLTSHVGIVLESISLD